MKPPTSSACSPKPEPDPALPPSKQPPAQPSSRVGQLSLPMRQLLPLRPVCCSKISLPTTTMTETFHRSATSFPTRAPPYLSVASQQGSGRSGLTPSLPQTHLETGQYNNSLCPEAAQYNSPVSMDLKRSGGKKKIKKCVSSIFFPHMIGIYNARTDGPDPPAYHDHICPSPT